LSVLFEVHHATVDGRPVLRVRGELDIATVAQLGEAVARALESGPASLVVDLGETTFLDSSGARQLARTGKHCRDLGVALQVVCPAANRPVRMVIDLLELHLAVPVVEAATSAGGEVGS
jgi:anti-anti-sigma factor